MAGYYLAGYNLHKFVLWFIPALAFINVGGAFAEVTTSMGASVVLIYLITSPNLLFALLISLVLTQLFRGVAMRLLPF